LDGDGRRSNGYDLVVATAAAMIPVEPAVYSRRARQIRARFAGQPGAMHLALRGLAERSDRKPWQRPDPSLRRSGSGAVPALPSSSVCTALERGFAGFISDRLASGPFTFSDRMKLLQSAERIGMSRFQANLIVSLAQHSAGTTPRPAEEVDRLGRNRATAWKYIIVALATELIIAGSIYLSLR
jgi:hypothetical protein